MEDGTMVLETIEHLNTLQIEGIKLQLLHYLRDTDLGRIYQEKEEDFHVLSLDEYASMTAHCIGHLDPKIVIHRLTGDGNQQLLLAPSWSTDKQRVLNLIRHKMKEESIVQGSMRGEENE